VENKLKTNRYTKQNQFNLTQPMEKKSYTITFFTPFYISNTDFNGKKIKKRKINSRNFTYDGLTFSSSGFILEEVKDEICY